jgi:hypothetical protein
MKRVGARLIERVTCANAHAWSWRPVKCWQCGKRTWWIEVNFEAATHRGRCTRLVDDEYFAALAAPMEDV